MLDKYKLVGPAYDWLGAAYSGNAIHHCKLAMLRPDTLNSESKVLFAGAGHGKDALEAARMGAQVTVVEISPTMLKKLERTLSQESPDASAKVDVILGDILKHENFAAYDMVVANFFLNVFDRSTMQVLLKHLCKLCKPGGEMVIGDFLPSQGNLLKQSIQNAYWYAATSAFFVAAGNAIHQLYDYRPLLEKLDFEVVEDQAFKVLGVAMFQSLRARKRS